MDSLWNFFAMVRVIFMYTVHLIFISIYTCIRLPSRSGVVLLIVKSKIIRRSTGNI